MNADRQFLADVLVSSSNGKIVQVRPPGKLSDVKKNARIIDAKDKLVMPGGIDSHTHLQIPFMGTVSIETFESGSNSALVGGTTSFCDFIIPSKGQTLKQGYDTWRERADSQVNCDYTLHCAIPSFDP